MLTVSTRFIGPKDFGQISVFLTLITLSSGMLALGFHANISHHKLKKSSEFGTILFTCFSFVLLVNLVIAPIIFYFDAQIAHFLRINTFLLRTAVFAAYGFIFFHFYRAIIQAKNQSRLVAQWELLKTLVEIGLCVLFFFLLHRHGKLHYGLAYARLIVFILMAGIGIFHMSRMFALTFSFRHLKNALLFSIPLLMNNLLSTILAQFDRIAISQIQSNFETGIYSLAYNLCTSFEVLIMSGNFAWSPLLYKTLKQKNYGIIKEKIKLHARGVFCVGVGFYLSIEYAIYLLSSEQYHESVKLLPFIILAMMTNFFSISVINFVFFHEKTISLALFTFIITATNVALNYWLIPIYGYTAAAHTTLFCSLLGVALHYTNAKRVLKKSIFAAWLPLQYIAAFVGVILLNSLINACQFTLILKILLQLLMLLGISILAFRVEIQKFITINKSTS